MRHPAGPDLAAIYRPLQWPAYTQASRRSPRMRAALHMCDQRVRVRGCAADGFSVGAYNFSCVKDCPAATCKIKREYEKGKTKMIVGALPDAFDTLACGSKITHL